MLRVLLIDDDARVLVALARLLRSTYDVVTFEDPAAALAHLAGGARFHAILCDGEMPGLSGGDVYSALDPCHARRFIFLSGTVESGVVAEYVRRFAVPALRKPPRYRELVDAIAAMQVSFCPDACDPHP